MLRLIAAALALSAGMAAAEDIKVGVTPGEHAEIMEQIVPLAAAKGLNIDVIEFSDYVVPNTALADGDLNANSFQHVPYLENQIKDRGFEIVAVAKTITTPMGVYSNKVKSLDELADGATVAIPNDPTNGGRALVLLANAGVIKLRDGGVFRSTVLDITDNPKRIRIVELDAAQIARALDDVDAGAVTGNYAVAAGLDPLRESLVVEQAGPALIQQYCCLVVVRQADAAAPWAGTLASAYADPGLKAWVTETFKGAVIPGA